MKKPKKIEYRKRVVAKVYRPSKGYPHYRLSYYSAGRRVMRHFPTYSAALQEAERLAPELYEGSNAALTKAQARDALAAFEVLRTFYQSTGRKLSLVAAASEYCDLASKLSGISPAEAINAYLRNTAAVKRKDLAEAVTEFIEGRKHLSESKDGKRPKLSPVYAYNVAMWLNEFAGTFPGHAVCDLTKQHIGTYISNHTKLSAKSRNDRRAVVKMFLSWAVAKDYLSVTHRLFETVELKRESADIQERIEFYTPKELKQFLEAADAELLPMLALGGLAGLRIEEMLRLSWEDVWRVPGKIEIGARIAKGRKRRLVSMCASLKKWLLPYRRASGLLWSKSPDAFHEGFGALRETLKVPARRNGLRHSFVTYHMAMHGNENLTAAEAGNSPQMIHDHYRGLARKKEANGWFTVAPKNISKPADNVIQLREAKN